LLPLLCLAVPAAADRPPELDLVIANGRVVDGTGAPWFRADVGVRGDRIVAVGDLSKVRAVRRVDAAGKVVAPGFIDLLGQSELHVLADNRLESKLRQGITTEVTGEGLTVAPLTPVLLAESQPWLDAHRLTVDWTDLEGYWRRLRRSKSALNLATYVGAAQVRGAVLGLDDVQPTPQQLQRMEALVDTAMRQGAVGLSAALIYPPGAYARTPELVALARVAARHGGLYATHLRGEDERVLDALEEAITIGREAGIPVEVWHLKVSLKANWGRMPEVLARIERARAEGVDITADVYPYVAASNSLSASIPQWAQAGGVDAMVARFHQPATRARILEEVRALFEREPPSGIQLASTVSPALKPLMGKRLDQVAREQGKPPEEALLDIVEADRGQGWAVRYWMAEEDVRLALKQPWVSLCTDNPGQALDGAFAGELAHPRAFGGMARVLGKYVREERLLTLEEAVRKLTSQAARRVRLLDRGLVRPGMAADLVVFDPAAVRDLATFEDPLRYSEGFSHVVVNGALVLDGGKLTPARPGRPLVPTRP
jgi:dihydroorotase/N-acyl-D-amino-acid deacylase